ncbi:hypothetical protein BGW36DRAFT_465620 [Talaromyces proteolyticus]|uniref:Apple domain-containing protein n=1 Tax=Talaromyces proteolyticus TaxID=1131652 RepID=A0AAD4KFH0_9EURO|nr:uncharacterized protein BGW36DRAFT_465620 [Talaromyces proteolyticus]KAH8690750.1 hypothetical protein BGW36DRAFT_465620 [Talaromyces proteolyticus]
MVSLNFAAAGETHALLARSGSCSKTGNYTTPDGLNFTAYCGEDIVSTAYYDTPTKKNFTQCMDDCSTENYRCWGVAWQESNSSCWGLTSDHAITSANLTGPSSTRDIALGNTTQLGGNTSCPYANNTILPTQEGLDFKLACYTSIDEDTLSPWNLEFCRVHVETLEECMDACAQAHPRCQAAMWNPGLMAGYLNCFLKNDTGPLVANTNYIYHTAVAEYTPLSQGCPTYSNWTANDKTFDIKCSKQITQANNLTFYHQDNITACIDSCASHSGPPACEAVVFDATLDSGYENCQLFSDVKMTDDSTNLNIAQFSTATSSNSSSSNSSSNSSSKAWIAGPVIGGVVAIGVIGFIWFWWKRRQARRQSPEEDSSDTVNQDKNKLPATVADPASLDALSSLTELAAQERVELPSEERRVFEMGADGNMCKH